MYSRFENHSPNTAPGNCNMGNSLCGNIGMEGGVTSAACLDRGLMVKNDRNNGSTNESKMENLEDHDEPNDVSESFENTRSSFALKVFFS